MKRNLAVKEEETFTYEDYLTWPEDERWQIINGIAYNMSPAPDLDHQTISGELHRQFANYLLDKTCRVFASPVDIIFPASGQDIKKTKDVVQPDIIVVCDHKKLHERKRCIGAPDLAIEILSPSTAYIDMKEKRHLYEREAVREYWIVDPVHKTVQTYILDGNQYKVPEVYSLEDKIKVSILPELEIDLALVFKEYF
ncbi:MAG: Uma2 family endonuclease [Candidatus Eremiobacterota bacterium]